MCCRYDTATITDDMINLELILGASVVTGRCDYFDAAINHARSNALGHVEASGFVHHDVVYNKVTGDVVTTLVGQVIPSFALASITAARAKEYFVLTNKRRHVLFSS